MNTTSLFAILDCEYMKHKSNQDSSIKLAMPSLILNKKEAERFISAIKNPPKANKALRKLIEEVKTENPDIIAAFR